MNFNSILLITFCLLQVLNCAKVKLSEQSLKRALTKTLNSQISHQDSIKLSSSYYTDLIFTYSPLTSDNIQLLFHDSTERLFIDFVNLNATLTGKYSEEILGYKIITEFTAKLNNFEWEQEFDASKLYLGNRQFTPTIESSVGVSVDRFTQKTENIPEELKDKIDLYASMRKTLITFQIAKLDYTEVKTQLRKISQLILQNLQSELK